MEVSWVCYRVPLYSSTGPEPHYADQTGRELELVLPLSLDAGILSMSHHTWLTAQTWWASVTVTQTSRMLEQWLRDALQSWDSTWLWLQEVGNKRKWVGGSPVWLGHVRVQTGGLQGQFLLYFMITYQLRHTDLLSLWHGIKTENNRWYLN